MGHFMAEGGVVAFLVAEGLQSGHAHQVVGDAVARLIAPMYDAGAGYREEPVDVFQTGQILAGRWDGRVEIGVTGVIGGKFTVSYN